MSTNQTCEAMVFDPTWAKANLSPLKYQMIRKRLMKGEAAVLVRLAEEKKGLAVVVGAVPGMVGLVGVCCKADTLPLVVASVQSRLVDLADKWCPAATATRWTFVCDERTKASLYAAATLGSDGSAAKAERGAK